MTHYTTPDEIFYHAHWIAGENWVPDHWWNKRFSLDVIKDRAIKRFKKHIGTGALGVNADGHQVLWISSEDGQTILVEIIDDDGNAISSEAS